MRLSAWQTETIETLYGALRNRGAQEVHNFDKRNPELLGHRRRRGGRRQWQGRWEWAREGPELDIMVGGLFAIPEHLKSGRVP